MQLFVERALLVRPEFEVTNQNAPALASLCCHLDGIPLAIELAAARVRSLSVEEIDGKLDQRFRLLTGGSRTALPRQQTLRSLIDWSYDLLHEPERLLLQRLSVFAGGWTLEAAEAVCAGDGVADSGRPRSADFARGQEPGGGGADATARRATGCWRPCASMPATGSWKAAAASAFATRHRDYFLALAEEAEPKLQGAEQAEWLQRLEEEHENLRAASTGASSTRNRSEGLRLCGALQRFWWTRGHLSEGREWCARVLCKARRRGAHARSARRRSMRRASWRYGRATIAAAARRCTRRAWRSCGKLGDREGIAVSLNGLGNVASQQGDYPTARALLRGEPGDQAGAGRTGGASPASLNNLGMVAYELARLCGGAGAVRGEPGDHAGTGRSEWHRDGAGQPGNRRRGAGRLCGGLEDCEESLAIMRELGDQSGIARSLDNLGDFAQDSGDYPAARALYEEDLAISRTLGDKLAIAYSLEGLAALRAGLGNALRAARIWGAAERLREDDRIAAAAQRTAPLRSARRRGARGSRR